MCDGPPRHEGDRAGLLSSALTGDATLFDDGDDPAIHAIAEQLAADTSALILDKERAVIVYQPHEENRRAAS